MSSLLKNSLSLLLVLLVLTGCEKKEFKEFYERPAGLADPIYQELEAMGKFKHFLACIDKAGYKDILGKAGYWTIFAPNDDAFEKYFQANGIAGVEGMDAKTAERIVKYALVYNAFNAEKLADYQSSIGWQPSMAFKRRTAFYEGVQPLTINGQERLVINSNRNNRSGDDYYNVNDNNNKYVPYFLSRYFSGKGLTAADYNYFYPNTAFTGFNVAGAQVINRDMVAENGVIHEIDQVLAPLPNIDQYMASQEQYSKFKAIFDKYMVSYLSNAAATDKNSEITGVYNNVYVKVYDAGLMYSPNNENYLKFEDNDGQQGGYSFFAPTNAALDTYLNTVLLEHYKTLDALPKEIIYDFLNAHMWTNTVWPSKFASTQNSFGQGALFNPASDVVDKQVLSNGLFYGTSKVQEANVFSSVFGKAYLDPKFSMMTRALTTSLKPILINTGIKFTLFLVSDEVLQFEGFRYNLDANRWEYTPPAGGATLTGTPAWDKLNRIINTHVALTDFSDVENSRGIIETYNGEYIKYSHNTVYSTGNMEQDVHADVLDVKTTANGTVYYLDRLLREPTQAVGIHLKKLAEAPDSRYKRFYEYLSKTGIYTEATGAILGITAGSPYTLLVPDNDAIEAAIAADFLPASPTSTATEDVAKVINFIRYHIIDKGTVVPDGRKEGGYLTLLQKDNGDPTTVQITNTPGNMVVRDMMGSSAAVVTESSNRLSNNTVIHLLNGFLKFDR